MLQCCNIICLPCLLLSKPDATQNTPIKILPKRKHHLTTLANSLSYCLESPWWARWISHTEGVLLHALVAIIVYGRFLHNPSPILCLLDIYVYVIAFILFLIVSTDSCCIKIQFEVLDKFTLNGVKMTRECSKFWSFTKKLCSRRTSLEDC